MSARFITAVLVACVVVGCSSTKYVSQSARRSIKDTVSLTQFNSRVSQGDIILHRTTGGDIFTGSLTCMGDTCTCMDGYSAELTKIPVRDVTSVEHRNFRTGRILGALVGGAGGMLVGGFAGWAWGGFSRDAAPGIAELGGLGAIAGAVAGYLIGGKNGSYTEYRFPPPPAKDSLCTQRPPKRAAAGAH